MKVEKIQINLFVNSQNIVNPNSIDFIINVITLNCYDIPLGDWIGFWFIIVGYFILRDNFAINGRLTQIFAKMGQWDTP